MKWPCYREWITAWAPYAADTTAIEIHSAATIPGHEQTHSTFSTRVWQVFWRMRSLEHRQKLCIASIEKLLNNACAYRVLREWLTTREVRKVEPFFSSASTSPFPRFLDFFECSANLKSYEIFNMQYLFKEKYCSTCSARRLNNLSLHQNVLYN